MRKIIASIICCGLVLASAGIVHLRAQGDFASDLVATTPAAAAKMFIVGLTRDVRQSETAMELVSNKSTEALGQEGVLILLDQMATALRFEQWDATVKQPLSNESVVVQVTPRSQRRRSSVDSGKPVVCIREGKWARVDLVETYRLWNGLSEAQAAQSITDLTGVPQPGATLSEPLKQTICRANLKQVGLAMLEYTQDYDERYPPAKQWTDGLRPYSRNELIFQCPSANKSGAGYAMNCRLSKKETRRAVSPNSMVLLYDTLQPNKNATGTGADVNFRHLGGCTYAFTDGHVRWAKADNSQQFTFRPPPPMAQLQGLPELPGLPR